MNNTEGNNFDILGLKVKLQENLDSNEVNPQKVVEKVRKTATQIKDTKKHLENDQLFLLTALKMAEELISLENDLSSHVDSLESRAQGALKLIEDASL